jgi:serine/threonine protein phosphatase PrpC
MTNFEIISVTKEGRKATGNRSGNQDRIVNRVIEQVPGIVGPVYFIAVADGVSQCSYGGSVARYVAERHLQTDSLFRNPEQQLAQQFISYIKDLAANFYAEFADIPEMLDSACTLSVAILYGDQADCLWVGDSPIFFSKADGNRYLTERVSVPDVLGTKMTDCFGKHTPCSLKLRSLNIGPGDIITVASDGLKHDEQALSQVYEKIGFNSLLTAELVEAATHSRFYDDISVVSAMRC